MVSDLGSSKFGTIYSKGYHLMAHLLLRHSESIYPGIQLAVSGIAYGASPNKCGWLASVRIELCLRWRKCLAYWGLGRDALRMLHLSCSQRLSQGGVRRGHSKWERRLLAAFAGVVTVRNRHLDLASSVVEAWPVQRALNPSES